MTDQLAKNRVDDHGLQEAAIRVPAALENISFTSLEMLGRSCDLDLI